jgi:hypothetical protein
MATVEQVALVRLLISDVDPARQVLSDDDILTFLNLEGDVVKLAAAQALDSHRLERDAGGEGHPVAGFVDGWCEGRRRLCGRTPRQFAGAGGRGG